MRSVSSGVCKTASGETCSLLVLRKEMHRKTLYSTQLSACHYKLHMQ